MREMAVYHDGAEDICVLMGEERGNMMIRMCVNKGHHQASMSMSLSPQEARALSRLIATCANEITDMKLGLDTYRHIKEGE